MRKNKGLSVFAVISIGFIISAMLLTAVLSVHIIGKKHSPSIRNVERLVNRGDVEQALSFARQISSESSQAILLKGKVYFLRALKKRKDERWKNYGLKENDWFCSEDLDSSLQLLQRIVDTDDKHTAIEACYYRGMIYREKGWYDKAENDFLRVLSLNPYHTDAVLGLSFIHVNRGRYLTAEELLRSGYMADPKNPDIAKNIAYLYRYYIDLPESSIVWFNRYLNNAKPRDLDKFEAKNEYDNLVQRYPEYTPAEPQRWRTVSRKFKLRNR